MGYRFSHIALGAAALAPFAGWSTDGRAQNYTVQSISPSTASTGTFTGAGTTLTMSPSGSFSPSGYQRSATSTTYTVNVKCASHAGNNCGVGNTWYLVLKDTSSSNTGRLGPLQSFTMGSTTLTVSGPSSSGTPPAATYTLGGMTNGQTATFQVGFNVPLQSSGATGSTVTRTFSIGSGVATGSITSTMTAKMTAIVWNPMAIGVSSSLDFGKLVKPQSGTATFTLSPAGALSVSGGGAIVSGYTPHVPSYTVTGEGAQGFSMSVPASFTIASASSNTLTVTTTASISGTTFTLSSALGSLGSYGPFTVGGLLPVASTTPSGAYTGNLVVGVNYN